LDLFAKLRVETILTDAAGYPRTTLNKPSIKIRSCHFIRWNLQVTAVTLSSTATSCNPSHKQVAGQGDSYGNIVVLIQGWRTFWRLTDTWA